MTAHGEDFVWILHLDGEPIAGLTQPQREDQSWVSYQVVPFAGFEASDVARCPIAEIEARLTYSTPGEDVRGPGIITGYHWQQILGQERLCVRGPYIERPPPARPWFWQQLVDWFKGRRTRGELSIR